MTVTIPSRENRKPQRITAAAEKRREAIASAQAARAAPSLQTKGIPAGNADSCQQHAQAAHL